MSESVVARKGSRGPSEAPAVNIIEVNFGAGTHVSRAAKMLVEAATTHDLAWGTFNELRMEARPGDTAEVITAEWDRQSDARSAAYRASPEGIAAEARSQGLRRTLQDRHDALMARLPTLDWNDDVAVLDWCCEMQEPSDCVGVIVKGETIIAEFAKHGFTPNMRTGADYIEDSRLVSHAYLIGQALAGLQRVAIHSILHKFAAEWKARFGVRNKQDAEASVSPDREAGRTPPPSKDPNT